MLKKIILLGFIAIVFTGCKKFKKYTQFDMDFYETITIPSSSGINLPFNILSPDVETNSETTFAVNDTRKDLIEEIKLTSMKLTLISPSNADFSFLESVSIYISADGLSEIKVAWKEPINSTNDELTLDVSDKDLKEYIKQDKFVLRLNATTDEILTTDHKIETHSIFHVDAKVLGQ